MQKKVFFPVIASIAGSIEKSAKRSSLKPPRKILGSVSYRGNDIEHNSTDLRNDTHD